MRPKSSLNTSVLLVGVLAFFVAGCDGGSSDTADVPTKQSFATLRSSDRTYVNLNAHFNTWHISRQNAVSEIQLELQAEPLTFGAPAAWALVIRMPMPDPSGVKLAQEIDARLFENYSVECCLNNA